MGKTHNRGVTVSHHPLKFAKLIQFDSAVPSSMHGSVPDITNHVIILSPSGHLALPDAQLVRFMMFNATAPVLDVLPGYST